MDFSSFDFAIDKQYCLSIGDQSVEFCPDRMPLTSMPKFANKRMIKEVIILVAVFCFANEVFGRGRPLLPSISFAIGWKLSVLNFSASFVRFATEAHIQHTTNRKIFDCLTWFGQVGLIGRQSRPKDRWGNRCHCGHNASSLAQAYASAELLLRRRIRIANRQWHKLSSSQVAEPALIRNRAMAQQLCKHPQ